MNDKPLWRAVLDRDPRHDGAFVYAVTSTGIYCRASCPARRPARQKVRFFRTPDAAESAGFRACRRCHPRGDAPQDFVEAVACRIEAQDGTVLRLDDLARGLRMAPRPLARRFQALL